MLADLEGVALTVQSANSSIGRQHMYTHYQVADEISSAVEEVWQNTKAPLLTSKLGLKFLSEDARAFLREAKIPLKKFIATYLQDKIRIVEMPRQGGGLAPKAETSTIADSELVSRYESPRDVVGATQLRPKFFPEVWSAFRDEIPSGKVALLTSVESDKPEVKYVDSEYSPDGNEYIIESHDTAITSAPDRQPSAAEVRRAIAGWAERRSIPLNKLMFLPADPSQVVAERKSQRHDHRSPVSFIDVLAGLTKDELMRISFPGDVVVSIIKSLTR